MPPLQLVVTTTTTPPLPPSTPSLPPSLTTVLVGLSCVLSKAAFVYLIQVSSEQQVVLTYYVSYFVTQILIQIVKTWASRERPVHGSPHLAARPRHLQQVCAACTRPAPLTHALHCTSMNALTSFVVMWKALALMVTATTCCRFAF